MKTFFTWTAIALLVIGAAGLLTFLYFIPPFLTAPPETFSKPVADAPPPATDIADARERMLAERGRYIVMTHGCEGCHATNGARGPDYSKYLAGGALKVRTADGTFISRNLTPDRETGLGQRSDEDVKRTLRSGVLPDGHIAPYTAMPWAGFSHWTEEDRYAVVVYLRHLPAIRHQIPAPTKDASMTRTGAIEEDFAARDYGVNR